MLAGCMNLIEPEFREDHPTTRNLLNQPLKRSLAPIFGPEYREDRKLKSNQ